MRRNLVRIAALAVLALELCIVPTATHADNTTGDSSAAAGIAIISPTSGESLADSSVQISGTAPVGVLIAITIDDTDTNQPLVAHQRFGKVQGTVTSDQSGHWVYTPQQAIIAGNFSVQANFTTTDNQTISSRSVQFVVTTSSGSSHVFSQTAIRAALIGAGLLALLVLWLIIYLVRGHRRGRSYGLFNRLRNNSQSILANRDQSLFMNTTQGKHLQEQQIADMEIFEDETIKIEEELSKTAEELERANAEVIALRHRFSGNSAQTDSTAPQPSSSSHKPKPKISETIQ